MVSRVVRSQNDVNRMEKPINASTAALAIIAILRP